MLKRSSIGKALLKGIITFILILGILLGSLGIFTYYRGMIDKYQTYLHDVLSLTLTEIDGDDLAKCIETKTKSEQYEKTQLFINNIKENYGLEYIYIIKPLNTNETDNVMNVMGGITKHELETEPEIYTVVLGQLTGDDYTPESAQRYLDGMNADDFSYFRSKTEYSYDYTGMVPIKDSSGKPVAVLAADVSMAEITSVIRQYIIMVLIEILVLTALISYSMFKWLNDRIVDPLHRLETSSSKFVESTHSSSNPNEIQIIDPKIDTNDEIEDLSVSMVRTFTDMKKYMSDLVSVTKEKERIGAELNVATNIQRDMLPNIFPAFPGRSEFDIYATMDPAKEVGGDFYDFFFIDDTHIGLVMADVSGKGVPAALFMVISKTLIKNRAMLGGSPSEIIGFVNNQLCESNESDLFVTVWFAIIDITTGKGVSINAGHEHPAICRKGGKFELDVYPHSLIVGGMNGVRYREHEFELAPGDTLFIYTDGVPEATNASEELYGTDRMLEALNKKPDGNEKELLANVTASIDEFVGTAPQADDTTMMAFIFRGVQNN